MKRTPVTSDALSTILRGGNTPPSPPSSTEADTPAQEATPEQASQQATKPASKPKKTAKADDEPAAAHVQRAIYLTREDVSLIAAEVLRRKELAMSEGRDVRGIDQSAIVREAVRRLLGNKR